MSDYTVTLTISDEAYRRAQRIAEESAQPIERILANRLEVGIDDAAGLPLDEQAELVAMQHLSDDALWSMARERFARDLDTRQQVLGDRNSRALITLEEYQELERLVERGNRLMVRKAEAMALLTKRGYRVSPDQLVG